MTTKTIVFPNCEDGTCEEMGCQTCCPHDEYDHGICLDCELDRNDDLAARSYDRAKDARKYGDT
jgi:hypothetical protein